MRERSRAARRSPPGWPAPRRSRCARGPASAAAAEPDQGAALSALVRAEEDAAFVYLDAGLGSSAARWRARSASTRKALATHLEALGLAIPGPARGRDGLGPAALAVLEAGGGAARLRAAIAFEQALDRTAARSGSPQLEAPGTLRTVATVMASHAQHRALLERAAGRDPLSSAP